MMDPDIHLTDDVYRTFTHDGRLIIPTSGTPGPEHMVSRDTILRPVIDVLLKQVDLTAGGEEYALRANGLLGRQGTRWEYGLPVPIDLKWLRSHAVIPPDIRFAVDEKSGRGQISNGWNVIISRNDALARHWVNAGWRMGEPYSGPIPAPRLHWWQR